MRYLSAMALMIPVAVSAQQTMAGRSAVYAPHGVIATSQPLATATGLSVLQNGGNAIDAAVAAATVLSVVEPHMTGMGGDLFAIIWLAKDHKLYALNASGRSGSLMTREELVKRGRTSIHGVEAITVPGALSGWQALLDRFGTRKLADILKPAIGFAEDGFPVTPLIAREWQGQTNLLHRDPGAAATFLINGHAPAAGEWFRNPDYARTLRAVAANGPPELYGGATGQKLVEGLSRLGGFLTIEDLRNQKVEWLDPISVPFRGYRLWELPPNGQGVAALEMLRILDGYDLKAMGHNSAQYLHHLIEAKKLAYADLDEFVSDPATMRVNVNSLLSDDFVRGRRSMIDPAHAADRPQAGKPITASETIYLTAADAEGNMISFINSNYDLFGSGVVVPGLGFPLQNRGEGFTMREGHVNVVAPRKRPLHTIIPAFVTKTTPTGEEPFMSFGVMGGAMQPQGHVQVLLNLLVFGMDIQQAIDQPRFRHLSGLNVALEAPIAADVRARLVAMGHHISTDTTTTFGGAQAIIRLGRGWMAGSDPRKDGMAAGH